MSIHRSAGAAILFVALLLGAGSALSVSDVFAQASSHPASIRQALEQQIGKRVKLKLNSGQDVEGKVVGVTDKAVFVDELTGMEFYGATVKLGEVAAVIARTRTQ